MTSSAALSPQPTDQAFAAWVADRAAGLDALLIASTNAQVRELNLCAQAMRLAAAAVPAERRCLHRRHTVTGIDL